MSHPQNYLDFWNWFCTNEAEFPTTSEFDEAFGTQLSDELGKIEPDLVYEIATPNDGQKELIISADGIKDHIATVRGLVESAPALEDWEIIAFRPRMDDYSRFTLDFGERQFDPREIWCWSQIEDGCFDLIIYHPNYSDEERNLLVNGTYILLDMAIGEFDVMTGIRHLDHRELPDQPESYGMYRFGDLRTVFDEYKSANTH